MRILPSLIVAFVLQFSTSAAEPRWWKGNLHTHLLWSDGDDYPEMIAEWYKAHGYNFLALSDHNIIADHERWVNIAKSKGKEIAFDKYLARFGTPWVETRPVETGNARERLWSHCGNAITVSHTLPMGVCEGFLVSFQQCRLL
jgi:hypothetical protein